MEKAKKIHKQHYPKFKQINGEHSFKQAAPNSFVEYEVRTRHGGEVAAFNFDLAKEMGLIPKDHPNELNPDLEKEILDTFALVIINEYDRINNINYPKKDIRPHKYMATRYLQLQHPTKQGKTSGDGRSIWNGQVTHQGKAWDISSCGTGATKLSPATSLKNKFFQTGDPSISYGCGYSEIDEGLATLFFSEIMYRNKIETERVLAIIKFAKGISINVRAHSNLLRPSHMFNHLKQGNYDDLKKVVDYYINRQEKSKIWDNVPVKEKSRYEFFLQKETEIFAKMAANFEDEYIFCWLDWDGDNILMDGGVIDYGSIRQFGLFHHEYRYDDVERYSTTITEQKQKARYIVQTFIQIVDFLNTKKKKNISQFRNHKILKAFDRVFEEQKDKNLLHKFGFDPKLQDILFKKHIKLVESFRRPFSYFERSKSKEGLHEVEDGINWSAIYCMRDILRELPQLYLSRGDSISNEDFVEIIKSEYATDEDLKSTPYRNRKIKEFQNCYWKLVKIAAKETNKSVAKVLLEISMRSSIINKYDRVTGDSITHVVDKVLNARPKLSPDELYKLLEDFSEYQNLDPEKKKVHHHSEKRNGSRLFRGMLQIVREYREGL